MIYHDDDDDDDDDDDGDDDDDDDAGDDDDDGNIEKLVSQVTWPHLCFRVQSTAHPPYWHRQHHRQHHH